VLFDGNLPLPIGVHWLGAFTKMRKATTSFMSARLSVFMEQPDSPWNIVTEFYSSIVFENLPRKFKFH